MLIFNHRRLREIRDERHWSLENAAHAYGLSYPMTSKLERGEVRPSILTLGKLTAALDVSMDSLFHEAPDDTVVPASDLGAHTDAWIEQTLASKPPMTPAQAERISAILFGRSAPSETKSKRNRRSASA